MSEPGREFGGRPLYVWAACYLVAAIALLVASRVLDARQKFTTGLTRTFYEGDIDTGVVLERAISPRIDLRFVDSNPALPRRHFSVKWEGVWVRESAGWIDLHTGGDDEMAVRIDGETVLDRNPAQSRGERMRRFLLPAGAHRLEVRYRQEGGGYSLYVLWAPAGQVPGPLDPESLFPREPPERRLRTNHRLLLLRRVAAAVLVVPPILFVLLVARRPAWFRLVEAWRSWRARMRRNITRALAPAASAPPAAVRVPARRRVVWLHVVAALVFLFAVSRFRDPEYGFTGLIRFGSQFERDSLAAVAAVPHLIQPGSGYDGQFYAQLAIDPTLRDPALSDAIDELPYRGRRILLSWTAFLIGLGRPAWILEVYALQNVLFWLVLGVVLLRWLPPVTLRNWLAWCGCMFGYGAVASVHSALTDLPSVCLAAIGLALADGGRVRLGASVIGLCGLARETTLLSALGLDWVRGWRLGSRTGAAVTAAVVVAPVVLWAAYMAFVLGPRALNAGGEILTVPFSGMVRYVGWLVSDLTWSGWDAARSKPGLFAFLSLLLQAAYLVWRAEWYGSWWRVGIGYVLLLPLLGFQVWEGDIGAFVRVTLPLAIAYNISLPASRWFWPLLVLGNMTVPFALGQLGLASW